MSLKDDLNLLKYIAADKKNSINKYSKAHGYWVANLALGIIDNLENKLRKEKQYSKKLKYIIESGKDIITENEDF